MNKKVCIKIKGLHNIDPNESNDAIEVIHVGAYYKRNGKHYVRYEEPIEKSDKVSVNLLKMTDNEIELVARGETGTHMLFTRGQKNTMYYNTPFGGMNMGVDTYDLNVLETPDRIMADISYGLEINLDYVADCRVHIDIESI